MKKYTIIAYTALILIICLSGFFSYKVFSNNKTSKNIKEKTLAEVMHIENEFINLFNELKNINLDNYKILSSEIKDNKNKNNTSSSKQETTSSETKKSSTSKQESTSGGETKKTSSSENQEESNTIDENKKFSIEETGVLTEETEINWKQIKNDVEKIYTFLYPMTMDLYQTSTEQQDITNFNKEYDNFTKAVKEENKEESLKRLSILYDYIPKFIEHCTENEKDRTLVKTKKHIFKAYSNLDNEKWNTISNNIENALQEFSNLITKVDNKENEYNIKKVYIMINELQNSTTLKDKDVFLIKYKNLLEELKNM